MELLFWTLILVVLYAYLGYGIVLYALVKLRTLLIGSRKLQAQPEPNQLPEVSLVIAAYNEAGHIQQKIQNSLALSYPQELLVLFFVTDGSNDGTDAIIRNYPWPAGTRWVLEHRPERKGKIAAVERIMPLIQSPVTIYTDANTDVNQDGLLQMVRHFQDKAIGCVAGEKRIAMGQVEQAAAAGEGLYWKYESKLKTWDAELYSVVGAAGELFAIRTALFEPVPADTLIEDFVLSLRIAQRGFRVVYEPQAYAVETGSADVKEEMKRKIRIAAGGLQAIMRLSPLLNIFQYGVLSFQYISHRVLRWTLAPLALPLIFVLNVWLAFQEGGIYQWMLWGQLLFYTAAMAGWYLASKKLKVKLLFVPYYFTMMNYSVYLGFLRLIRGNQSVVWEKAKRAAMVQEEGV